MSKEYGEAKCHKCGMWFLTMLKSNISHYYCSLFCYYGHDKPKE